jgi:histidinol-phosphatase (PHP family)
LGSVHPHLLYYQEGYFDGDILNYQHTYFEHLAMAAETGLFDTVAHPDLVKNSAPSEWDPERIMDVIRQCLDRIAATDTAMELNTSGMHKRVSEMNPGPLILAGMRRRDIPVVLGSDAHVPEHVAAAFEEALDRLVAAGYTQVDTVVDRKRTALPIAIARKSLRGV